MLIFLVFFSENFENSQLKFKGKSENLEVVKKNHIENLKIEKNSEMNVSDWVDMVFKKFWGKILILDKVTVF